MGTQAKAITQVRMEAVENDVEMDTQVAMGDETIDEGGDLEHSELSAGQLARMVRFFSFSL